MNPTDELEPHDEAGGLGRLGRLLDGSVDAAQHREGRERLVLALGASSRGQKARWLLLAATLACLVAGLGVVGVV
ncbi:MAG TPA: hypothetical protein VH044_08605, partial [Polyangiaceae bacterium]|nr:hypothetical protein [Polyangiaceae bacterium]